MCDPISMALMAAGTGISAYADGKARSKQGDAVTAAQNRRTQRQGEVSAAIDKLLNQFQPEQREQTRQAGSEQVQESLDDAVQASNEVAPVGAEFAGRTSDDFIASAGAKKSEELDRTTRIARLLGQIGGATRGRQTEGHNIANTNTDINQISNFARGDSFTDSLRIQEAGQANPWLKLLGGAAQGAGTAMGATSGVAGGAGSVGGAAGAATPGVAGPVATRKLPVMTVRPLT